MGSAVIEDWATCLAEQNQPWLAQVRKEVDGFFQVCSGVGLGAVALCVDDLTGDVLVVRKSVRPGYEFSNLYALPGGMIRWRTSTEALRDAIAGSLFSRCERETGLLLSCETPLIPIDLFPPPTTRYLARGVVRHTLVLPFRVVRVRRFVPHASDASVTEASWQPPAVVLPAMAPANRVILAHVLWSRLSATAWRELVPCVQEAVGVCAEWARSVGVAPVSQSWP